MFTGIIEELGTLVDRIEEGTSLRLQIEAERVFQEDGPNGPKISENGIKLGDSIAINGVCQTVVSVRPPFFEVIAVQETLQKTTLGSLTVGSGRVSGIGYQVSEELAPDTRYPIPETRLNLERAATLQTRLGGHLVQGHVDGRASVHEIRDLGGSWEFYFMLPSGFTRYIIPQGSVTLNGVSLTVAAIEKSLLKVAIIPHTYYHTNFQYLKVGDEVNVELDVIAKMVERLIPPLVKA
jgi:riboflavin synthase